MFLWVASGLAWLMIGCCGAQRERGKEGPGGVRLTLAAVGTALSTVPQAYRSVVVKWTLEGELISSQKSSVRNNFLQT